MLRTVVVGTVAIALLMFAADAVHAGPSTGNPCKPGATNHSQRLVGTRHADHLCGGNTQDLIFGKGGADRLAGNHGNDRIWGGAGDDKIVPGKGRDYVNCGPGRDLVLTNFPANGIYKSCELFKDPA